MSARGATTDNLYVLLYLTINCILFIQFIVYKPLLFIHPWEQPVAVNPQIIYLLKFIVSFRLRRCTRIDKTLRFPRREK